MKAGIALGSNFGNRERHLESGFAFLKKLSTRVPLLRSDWVETDPVDCAPGTRSFLNAAAEIDTELSPFELLTALLTFEKKAGRKRVQPGVHEPRPLDLDLLYYENAVIQTLTLTLPHPRMFERRFVLEPLAQIKPDLVLPGEKLSITQILGKLPS